MSDSIVAARVKRWAEVSTQIKLLQKEHSDLQELLGFNDTQDLGHYDGTNSREYMCRKCNDTWLCGMRIPCEHCHPEEFAELTKVKLT